MKDESTTMRAGANLHPSVRAFTLVELLVVIGIIALLASILLGTVLLSKRKSDSFRIKGDLQTIATALEAYKQDFGDYPRIPTLTSAVGSYQSPAPTPNAGAATLVKALLGPSGDGIVQNGSSYIVDTNDPPSWSATQAVKIGDCVTSTSKKMYVAIADSTGVDPDGDVGGATPSWALFDPHDGNDGPGFRIRNNLDTGVADPRKPGNLMMATGKVYGPYVQVGKLKTNGMMFFDHLGGPILYFPARPGQINVNQKSNGSARQPYVDRTDINNSVGASLYDADDNFEFFRRRGSGEADATVLNRIRIMLGDWDANGYINGSEIAINQPYLLWSPGPDDQFGPVNYDPSAGSPDENQKQVTKCDDVTNFR